MLKKLNNLSFVIGLFFLIVAIILLINCAVAGPTTTQVNLYAGLVFLLFGVVMMSIK
jgi:predicted membrane channel-forming protein YqfA (hemolysin III family)